LLWFFQVGKLTFCSRSRASLARLDDPDWLPWIPVQK
jgi:hypothetical protein